MHVNAPQHVWFAKGKTPCQMRSPYCIREHRLPSRLLGLGLLSMDSLCTYGEDVAGNRVKIYSESDAFGNGGDGSNCDIESVRLCACKLSILEFK